MSTATTGLSETLAFLRTPGALGDGPNIELVETHMSCVLLTEHRVWKLKKPIRLPFVDYTTLERRRRSCEAELRLGRRLSPDVYLDIVPITAAASGLAIAGDGEIVDWLLVMRRLPEHLMLPQMLARDAATPAHADSVADVLATFYAKAPRASWNGAEYRARLHDIVVATTRELVDRGASPVDLDASLRGFLAALERQADVLDARVSAGRVIEAHGDLRPEHVCLETPPAFIDPLEFDEQLRTLDAISELAFLALECDRLGAAWFGQRVLVRYAARSGDRASPSVIALYACQHALTRALIALRHIEDAPVSSHARWTSRATEYLGRARALVATPSCREDSPAPA
jgi:aminoglycoside phosphotransferase family enzyme